MVLSFIFFVSGLIFRVSTQASADAISPDSLLHREKSHLEKLAAEADSTFNSRRRNWKKHIN
jgi:hypothetical protein